MANLLIQRKMIGGHSWDRTNDLPIKSRLLYQLSYMPNEKALDRCPGPEFLASPTGFEPVSPP